MRRIHRPLGALAFAMIAPWSISAAQAETGTAPTVAATAPSTPETATTNKDWWPNRLDLSPLRQNDVKSNPYGADFDYAAAFKALDLAAVKADIAKVLTTSQPWWPADYGSYGPFFIRMAWHSAGTYRTVDGRGGSAGGEQRFDPQNSWPDNANLDKARRLLWPIKQKYGRAISWGDLMVLTGNVALEQMGFKTLGFAGGRVDAWEPDMVFWGSEKKWLDGAKTRIGANGQLKGPLAAVQMGLIYVNPEGPGGNPDPIAAAADIRRAFGRMAMNDEETVALIAGGHTFGKAHGAHKPEECTGPQPAGGSIEDQGIGWKNKCGKGNAEDTVTSGLEGAWSANPIAFTTQYLDNLFQFDWVLTTSPAGAKQWTPKNAKDVQIVPDAHVAGVTHAPMMFTTDIAVKEDPGFRAIALKFRKDPQAFADAFARAWFKLTHRDMGPKARYIGPDVPAQSFLWQDPLPKADYATIDASDVATLKAQILASGLTQRELIRAAWASASTFRSTDMRGGANGARIRLNPEKSWAVNDPAELDAVLAKLGAIQAGFNKSAPGGKKVSLADLIVLGGNAAVEQAAAKGGVKLDLPFTPGRVDATQAQTDPASFAVLEPVADPFRNYYDAPANWQGPAEAMVDKADMLGLSVPELTVLVGGMRALDANTGHSPNGVLTAKPGTLSNDFFVNLLDMGTAWKKSDKAPGLYEGADRTTGKPRWTATSVDLIFGSNSELRAVAEAYAMDDAKEQFVRDFGAAWTKVMNADRF
ncbi:MULTISPECIES: catalase/peroxidase HPI [unclassified Novosphingobium]|uniref:catalase/peroxidase HPI n=1 Tax=unclassified Novosphingobium TaxID=2644732 RepID=UPI00146F6C0B|nr:MULTISPECIES: catalase/peroxidase HPI [unclassified Novosphingobium]NMN04207.1 catalase-peroxidase [Novosphingobium sp. SG919]NMN85801.1 catalase-peroxidase [Novosphingobium sp. SG916]